MKPFAYWTRASQPRESMCITCGAVRATLHLPEFKCDALARTIGPMLTLAFARHLAPEK